MNKHGNSEKQRNIDRVPINKPDGVQGATKVEYGVDKKFLNPSEYSLITPEMPSVQAIDINVPLYVPALTKASAISAFIAMAMGIAVDETITLADATVVGTLYFYAQTIAYDLYLSMSGSYSIFDSAPKWYWDLRCAVAPASRGGFAYSWIVPDTFIGAPNSVYPLYYPIIISDNDTNSLGYKTSSAPLDLIQVAPVAVAVQDILDTGAYTANAIWTAMSNLSESTKIVPNPYDDNPYTKSITAFLAYRPDAALDTVNDRWSTYQSEVPFSQWEEWVAFMGFPNFDNGIDAAGNAYTRTGKHVMKEFQYADYLGDRILCGKYGKVPTEYIRKKQISLEWLGGALLTQLVNADAFYNDFAGTNSINNAAWPKSVLYNIPISYINMVLASILRRHQLLNAAYFDNEDSLAFSLTGRKWNVGASAVTEVVTRYIKEFLGDCVPVVQRSSMGSFKTVAVITCFGNFSLDPTNDGSGTVPFDDLTGLINMMYQTATPAILYQVAPNNQGMFAYIDVTTQGIANFTGTAVAVAEQAITDAFGVLQGNLDCGVTSSNNNDCTLLYYSLLLNMPTIGSKEKLEKKKKFKNSGKRERDLVGIVDWTLTYGATFNQLSNKYAFTADLVSYDLTRGVTISFHRPPFHAAVYKEPNYLLYSQDEMVLFNNSIVNGAKLFAHPIATRGGYEPNEIIQQCTTQDLGGMFGGMAKSLLSGIPMVGGLLGELAAGLFGEY